jgi:hypothetical protein
MLVAVQYQIELVVLELLEKVSTVTEHEIGFELRLPRNRSERRRGKSDRQRMMMQNGDAQENSVGTVCLAGYAGSAAWTGGSLLHPATMVEACDLSLPDLARCK